MLGEMMLPNSAGVEVSQFTSKVYSGQYSSDGNFFYTACQDFRCVPALAHKVHRRGFNKTQLCDTAFTSTTRRRHPESATSR